MYQSLFCTCRAIVLLIKSFVLPRSRCRCHRGLLKLPFICVEKTGPDLFCQLRPQCLLKMVADRTSSVRDVCSMLLCQSIAIDDGFCVVID